MARRSALGPAAALRPDCKTGATAGAHRGAMTAPTTDTITPIDRLLAAICGEHSPVAWAEDAVLDAVVPGWRFTVRGAEAIDAQLRSWFRHPGTLEELRRHPTADGEVVELTVTWVEDGVPHAARQVHVLALEKTGRIAHDDMWCGGHWSAALLAEMEAASDAG
jgi:hypothetical protein